MPIAKRLVSFSLVCLAVACTAVALRSFPQEAVADGVSSNTAERNVSKEGDAAEAEPAVVTAEDSEVEVWLRSRSGGNPGEATCVASHEMVTFDMSKTAIVVVDMWTTHWCERMTQSGADLAPKINAFISEARSRGATIIHCPSGGIGHFAGHQAIENSRGVTSLRVAENGYFIRGWNRQLDCEPYPLIIDRTPLAGCPCEGRCRGGVDTHQLADIEVHDGDYLTQSGHVISGLVAEKGLDRVLYTGAAIERCVLGRPFGMRHMIGCGYQAHLVRDLVDGMHLFPWMKELEHSVSNAMSIEHVERFISPTILSASLLDRENQESLSREASDNDPSPRYALVSEGELESGGSYNLYSKVGDTTYECVWVHSRLGVGDHVIDLAPLLDAFELPLEVQSVQVLRDGARASSSYSDGEVSFSFDEPCRALMLRVTLQGE